MQNRKYFLFILLYILLTHTHTVCYLSCCKVKQCKDTVGDFQGVVSSGQCGCHVVLLLNDAVELSEGGEGSRTHPYNEILIYEAVVF